MFIGECSMFSDPTPPKNNPTKTGLKCSETNEIPHFSHPKTPAPLTHVGPASQRCRKQGSGASSARRSAQLLTWASTWPRQQEMGGALFSPRKIGR